jgi:hypothetical protein
MNKENKVKETAQVVLTPEVKTVELTVPAKPKKKRYHKPKAKTVVIDTPVVDITVEKQELTPVKPHLNWFQKQWNKFVLWYNA